jgi:hypothetical protein
MDDGLELVGSIEYRVMLQLYLRLKEDVKRIGLYGMELENIRNADGRGKFIRPLGATFGGKVSAPEIIIDFDWIYGNPEGLGIDKWSMTFDPDKGEESWLSGFILDLGDYKARIEWGWGFLSPIPDGHGPGFIYKGSNLDFDHPEEKADWLLKLAIGLDLGDGEASSGSNWEHYYEKFRPQGDQVYADSQIYPSDLVGRWGAFLRQIGAHPEVQGDHKFNLGDGVWGNCHFKVSHWDMYIGISEDPPTEEQQEIARRLAKGFNEVLWSFGKFNTDGWLFKNSEIVGTGCRILDCRNCDRVVLERYERGRGQGEWNWGPLQERDWCNKKDCIGMNRAMEILPHMGLAGKMIMKFMPSEPPYESQKPGLYNKVKAAQEESEDVEFRRANDPIVEYVEPNKDDEIEF